MNEKEKQKDGKQGKVKGRPKSSSVGYEIHRLNKKLERYEGTADLIDPEDLKKNVKGIMSQNDRHKGYAQRKIRKSFNSNDRGDMGDDGICFDYDDVTNIGKEASHIAEAVAQTEKEAEKGEWQEIEVANMEKSVHSEEDKKEQEREDEKKEEEQEMEMKEEEKEAAKEEWEEMEVENVGKAVDSEEDKIDEERERRRRKRERRKG
ncbi:uncharacterized protein DDB_G0283697-like [Asparagus officinalis]|uniref:uncharacterized protein DDB_G0283697-like n=1 Tax=Asparagus officinalis TaxID=4686 RepID=UPI00098E3B88|nr:uncharacterized protein DDB_G0283697-like [Asparagus officinalis]